MSTRTSALIQPANAAEQEMLDLLLRYPHGVRVSDLNPKKRVRRGEALTRWQDAGWLTSAGTQYWPMVALAPAAIDPDQQVDAHARAVMDDWRLIGDAHGMLEREHVHQIGALASIDELVHTSTCAQELMEGFSALQRSPALSMRATLDQVANAIWQVHRVRLQAEGSGVDWEDIIERSEEMIAQARSAEDAARRAAEAQATSIDPNADPLGGDA